MQERKFDNGGVRTDCPLRLMVAASNEWPIGEGYETVGAAFDRFLIRKVVRPVSPANRDRLLFDVLPAVASCLTLQDVDDAAREAKAIPVGDAAREALRAILDELSANGIRPGDRRIRKAVNVAQAAAWLDGVSPHAVCNEVQPIHLEPMQYVLWDDPQEQPQKASEIVCKIANPVGAEINGILAEADEVLTGINPKNLSAPETFAGLKKLEDCQKRLTSLPGNGRAQKARDYIKARLTGIRKQMLGISE